MGEIWASVLHLIVSRMPSVAQPLTVGSRPSREVQTRVPELVAGDHLTRPEFERRCEAMPELKKAELIEGVVFMGSPVRQQNHGKPHAQLAGWLAQYLALTPGVEAGDNATVRLDQDNEPQPDLLLRILPACGGQTSDEKGYIVGAPEFIAEIAASSASYDVHEKKTVYRRNGVKEYLVWLVDENTLHWWRLEEGEYRPLEPTSAGLLKSTAFPGLWLDAAALLAGDLARVLEIAREGASSAEQARFAGRLRQGDES